uniref:Uncharacterized protein n=1 Tax=Anguilla anguilla TaxID=7936 RepID=A0A0E9X431_ANGAN
MHFNEFSTAVLYEVLFCEELYELHCPTEGGKQLAKLKVLVKMFCLAVESRLCSVKHCLDEENLLKGHLWHSFYYKEFQSVQHMLCSYALKVARTRLC